MDQVGQANFQSSNTAETFDEVCIQFEQVFEEH